MTELTLLIRSQFSLWLNCYEMLSCYYAVVRYRQKPITEHSVVLLQYLSEDRFIVRIQYIHVKYVMVIGLSGVQFSL